MRVCALVISVMAGLLITSSQASASGQVYLMRGLLNVFSTGMDSLAEKLTRRGYTASVHNHSAYETLAIDAAKIHKTSKRPIIIIGHSLGADSAIMMASKMKELGAPVALIVTFGPTLDLEAPSNVRRVINYHQSASLWRGTIRKGQGFKGSLSNINLDSAGDVTHFNIEKIDRFHADVIAKIAASVGSGRTGQSAPTSQAAPVEKPAPAAQETPAR